MPELPYGSLPVPATPVWQLKGWLLDIRCSRCRRHTVLHVGDLVDQYSSEASVIEVVRRVRCGGLRWTPSVGQESVRLKRESLRFPWPLPIRGVCV
jgi:hypothetical protein